MHKFMSPQDELGDLLSSHAILSSGQILIVFYDQIPASTLYLVLICKHGICQLKILALSL